MESVEPGESGACNKAIYETGTRKQPPQFNDKRGIAQIRKSQRSGLMAMIKTVEDVLLEMVGVCERLALSYAILGGLAVRVHGIPRPTYDVDFEITVTDQQLIDFFEASEKIGYEVAAPYRKGWRDVVGGMPLVKLKTYVEIGRTIDVDVFVNDTPFQASMMERRLPVAFDDQHLWFVTPEDLILMKLLANRPRDQGDVADVIFVQGQLDESYMRHWAHQLDITDRLNTALATSN